jgi:hypothetical protein
MAKTLAKAGKGIRLATPVDILYLEKAWTINAENTWK